MIRHLSLPQLLSLCLAFVCAFSIAGCGGSASSASSPAPAPTLVSIALAPLAVTLVPGATQQLTVTGTFSNGTTQALTTGDTFSTSNSSNASVSSSGLVTVSTAAAAGATVTIAATNIATGVSTGNSTSSVITVSLGPTLNSVSAANATVQNNALCTAIQPFYWEVGNQTSALISGSQGVTSGGTPILASTVFSIASASKWIYGTYVVQQRGSAAALTPQDINFLHFTSGYTNMGDPTAAGECSSTNSPDTVNACLAETSSTNGLPYSYQNPATIGKFDYDGGHLENHASLYGGLGNVPLVQLGTTVGTLLGTPIVYTEPLLPGGIYASSNTYSAILRNILSGALYMHDALGIDPVCTLPSTTCNSVHSPSPEAWHYSMAHWVEDDPATNGDGAFSSAGAFGFYPWIEASKKYYGVISLENQGQAARYGYASAQCGRLIRRAWDTGIVQTGTIPTP